VVENDRSCASFFATPAQSPLNTASREAYFTLAALVFGGASYSCPFLADDLAFAALPGVDCSGIVGVWGTHLCALYLNG
jgi:hypothetical protein